ncbi:aminoglycoside adenylyltransferase domain-containing protein [Micromonospora sp. CPCC 205546]|uniref:aminoglycoside adenylyltransferase domain-containing protein n=1 Tax=Micromonospora sp. CPCC 205546 TaxID=3122397 RepID=UPI002FF328A3
MSVGAGRVDGYRVYSVAGWRAAAQDDPVASPEMVLSDLRDAWSPALAGGLMGLYVHGSLVAGDFAADRSDLDLLAVLDSDPDENLLAVLAGLHTDLDRRHPRWAGRIEVEYVSLAAARDAAHGGTGRDHVIARISPGEVLHLLPATTHRLVTWAAVRDHGRSLLGPPADILLPAVDPNRVRSALLDHIRDWPAWVTRMNTSGAQSYAVLTLCRAFQRLKNGQQLSKRQAADRTITARPRWAHLIIWARDWWYDSGPDTDPGRADDVRAFVNELSATILASEPATHVGLSR